jgi:hypothetical protein
MVYLDGMAAAEVEAVLPVLPRVMPVGADGSVPHPKTASALFDLNISRRIAPIHPSPLTFRFVIGSTPERVCRHLGPSPLAVASAARLAPDQRAAETAPDRL